METINVKKVSDCPLQSKEDYFCNYTDLACGDKIPEHCPLLKSDYLIRLVKDRESKKQNYTNG
jgi:hypothetical protein